MRQPELRLHHDVEAWPVAVRARLAVARDAGVDEARVELVERGVVEGVFGKRAGEVVLYHDVAGARECVQDLDAFFVREGERERAFVAVYLRSRLVGAGGEGKGGRTER